MVSELHVDGIVQIDNRDQFETTVEVIDDDGERALLRCQHAALIKILEAAIDNCYETGKIKDTDDAIELVGAISTLRQHLQPA